MIGFPVFIEKKGRSYIARSMALPGVTITAKTYEEAQINILDAIDNRIDELTEIHRQSELVISRLPIDEIIRCVYQFPETHPRKDSRCSQGASKEGLCWSHWKKIYSHTAGNTTSLKACPLCGESDRKLLESWDSPCSFKAENPDWREVLEEKKVTMRKTWAKENEKIKMEGLGKSPRCKFVFRNGSKCFEEGGYDSLCLKHSIKQELRNL